MPKFPPMDEEYHPSSSEEDESDCEPRRPYKTSNNILSHQDSVILKHHHLGDDTDLEAGTVISIGDTWELHDGSFLMTTELQRLKNDCSVKFFGYIFRLIGNFKDYFRSIQKEVQKQPKAFTALSDQDLSVVKTSAADLSNSQRQLDSGVPKASSESDPAQGKMHGHASGRNLGTGKEYRKDARESLVLAPNTNSNRIAKSTGSPAIRRSSRHLGTNLTRPHRNLSAQRTVPEQAIKQRTYTFADAFCGAGGMSIGARAAGLRIELPATRQQVASAVPPPVAKAILEEIKRSLMRTDASKSS